MISFASIAISSLSFECLLVLLESLVGDQDVPLVPELILRLAATYEQDRAALRVECKQNPPWVIPMLNPEFFHVGMLRTLDGIDARSAQIRPMLLKDGDTCQDRILKRLFQRIEPLAARFMEANFSFHGNSSATSA
jgi:hypothetical protein